jgi:REP element-mobilizing transposase RayT
MPGKPVWQRSFHDHIIRNDGSLNAIREYIAKNPINWEQDIDNLINR